MKSKDVIILKKMIKYCLDIVWNTLTEDIPVLKEQLENMV